MAQTITLEGFIHCKPSSWEHEHMVNGLEFSFWRFETLSSQGYAQVCPAKVTFELPEGFNPNPQFVGSLEAAKKKLMAEFQARVNEIDEQINRFTAIEYVSET